jgi:hypothetical protein
MSYDWWRNALQGDIGPVSENYPQFGFFKKRKYKGGPFLPVAIWQNEDGQILATEGDRLITDHTEICELWVRVINNPVSEEDYRFHEQNGHWPDEVPDMRGHNNPPEGAEGLKEQVEFHIQAAKDWLKENKIDTQQKADMAANFRDLLNELAKKAEAEHKEKKNPHLQKCREIDNKYLPLAKDAKAQAGVFRSKLGTYLAHEERKKREAHEAEVQRVQQENARREAEAIENNEVPPEQLELPPQPKVSAGGARGRKTGLKTTWSAEIVDYDKALAHFAEHSDVKALVLKLANSVVRVEKKNAKIPGVKVIEGKAAI